MTLLHKDRNNKKKNKSLQKTTFVVFLTEVAQRNVWTALWARQLSS